MSEYDVARDDLLLDALAAGRAPDSDDPTVALLAAFRTDLDAAVSPVVVPLRTRKRSATLIALAAAAGLVVGGLTAGVAVSDKPGQLLYAAHEAIVGKATPSHADDVTKLLDQASGALARRDLAGARRLLAQASALLPRVSDTVTRDALKARLALLQSYAVEPTPSPSPSVDDHGGRTPEPSETTEPGDDHGGSSGSSGSGSDDSPTASPSSDDHSGSDSSGSGSSGSGSGDTSPTSDSGGGHGSDDGGSGSDH